MKIDRGFWVIELWRDTVEIKCRQEVYFEKIIKVFFFFLEDSNTLRSWERTYWNCKNISRRGC